MALADNYEPTKDLANGSTKIFTAAWDPINVDYVIVLSEDYETGVQTPVTTGITKERLSNGTLKVTFDVAPGDPTPADSVYILLTRDVPESQEQPFSTSSGFNAKVVEGVFDKVVAMIQELREGFNRALSFPIGTSTIIKAEIPAPVAGKTIKGASDGLSYILSDEDPDEQAALAEGFAADAEASKNAAAGSSAAAANSAQEAADSAASIDLPGSPSDGDMLVYQTDGWKSIPAGTSGQLLESTGTTAPVWKDKSFVDRGDPSIEDFDETDFTTDDTWRDLDLSSIVPAGANRVKLAIVIKNTVVPAALRFRKNGNTNPTNSSFTNCQVANSNIGDMFDIPLDSNRVVEYLGTNIGVWDIKVTVAGWWL